MRSTELKVARIGNSRGVRIPATTLDRYRIGNSVVMEERSDGILLRTPGDASQKMSWEDTAREMSAEPDEWAAWDVVAADGLEEVPWESKRPIRVAEKGPSHGKSGRSHKR